MATPKKLTSNDVERLLSTLVEALQAEFQEDLTSVALFGSFARGDWHGESDIDLLVVCRNLPREPFERQRAFMRAAARADRLTAELMAGRDPCQWAPILKTEVEAAHHSPLFLDMTEDARLLHDRGGFFATVLRGMRERMRELGSHRVAMPDGSWYWDLKPDYRFGEVVEI